MPPAMVESPSPSMSALKTFLTQKKYNVTIIYWNIKLYNLQKSFLWNPQLNPDDVLQSSLLLLAYISVKNNDKKTYAKIKSFLMGIKPHYCNVEPNYYDQHITAHVKEVEKAIDAELQNIDFKEVLFIGMSVNLYQWICSSIIAEKIKEYNPHIPIVVGGINTKESACAFLKEFTQFDIATWGEGENILLEIAHLIEAPDQNNVFDIANIAFKSNNQICVSSCSRNTYIDLNKTEYLPYFTDYFSHNQLLKDNSTTTILPIEGSRGCHWRKCHFCYLNTGYKNRVRNASIISKHIRNLISEYNTYNFYFLDNDIISNDFERFSVLLNELTAIKDEFPSFKIVLAEIITKNISADYIRKMALAGFHSVQIGYESASDRLLQKIDKKNTFASNLCFIKFANKYNIKVAGANIITGLLEETHEDVLEAIENLRFLRFFFQHGSFRHNISCLGIMNSSRYFGKINDWSEYTVNPIAEYLPDNFLSEDSLNECSILEKISTIKKKNWSDFAAVENHYLRNDYTYKLYKKPNANIVYQEFLKNEVINELEIEFDSLDYLLLKEANNSVLSWRALKDIIENSSYQNITDCEILNIISELKREGILYSNYDYTEFITVIDIDNLL